jgi:hypothetical protein
MFISVLTHADNWVLRWQPPTSQTHPMGYSTHSKNRIHDNEDLGDDSTDDNIDDDGDEGRLVLCLIDFGKAKDLRGSSYRGHQSTLDLSGGAVIDQRCNSDCQSKRTDATHAPQIYTDKCLVRFTGDVAADGYACPAMSIKNSPWIAARSLSTAMPSSSSLSCPDTVKRQSLFSSVSASVSVLEPVAVAVPTSASVPVPVVLADIDEIIRYTWSYEVRNSD